MFDSLKYAKILEDAGLPREQAETHIRVLGDVVGEEMVTKNDLSIALEQSFERFFERSKQYTDIKFAEVQNQLLKMDQKIDNLENRLIIKLGGLMTFLFTAFATVTQILPG